MVKYVKKVWGSEEVIVNNELYCGKILHLCEGFQCSLHRHSLKDETFYVLSGEVLMKIGRFKIRRMTAGKSVHIRPYTFHQFAGLKDSKIIEFSTFHQDSDSYRETESGPIVKSDWNM